MQGAHVPKAPVNEDEKLASRGLDSDVRVPLNLWIHLMPDVNGIQPVVHPPLKTVFREPTLNA